MEGRLVLSDEEGLAIAWDAAGAQQHLQSEGLERERCLFIPESLVQAAGDDGLRVVRGVEGFEAQCWKDGFLRASRWWAEPLTPRDWQEFVHASGGARHAALDVATAVPEPQVFEAAAVPWAKHYPLHVSANDAAGLEHRLVLAGALGLTLSAGALAHQFWDAQQKGRALSQQISDTKTAAATVLSARDATVAAVDDVKKMANWFAVPQPIDVIGYLHDALGRSGVQVKDLELEGDKLRLGLQLTPQATRAAVVKDLQAGGWVADVTEVRADNARGLLTMEMRLIGSRPPAAAMATAGAAPPAAAPVAAPVSGGGVPPGVTAAFAAGGTPAPAARVPAPAPAAVAPRPATAPAAPASAVMIPGPPLSSIMKDGKLDPSYVPPADVFNTPPRR